MQQAQAKSIDTWSYGRARNTQAKGAGIAADAMKLAELQGQGPANALPAKGAYLGESKSLSLAKRLS